MNSEVVTFIQSARFEATRFRDGYDMEDVDRLLDEVSAAAGQMDPEELGVLPRKIQNSRFTVTKFREGYDMVQVDDFLDELTNKVQVLESALSGEEDPSASDPIIAEKQTPAPNKFSALDPLLGVEFPIARTDGYSKKDVDSFVSLLKQLRSGSHTFTVAEALQIAEHLSPKPAGVFSKGYDRQQVDAFTARVVGVLRSL